MNRVPHRVRVILRALGLPNTSERRALVMAYIKLTTYNAYYYTHARADDVVRYIVALVLGEWNHPGQMHCSIHERTQHWNRQMHRVDNDAAHADDSVP